MEKVFFGRGNVGIGGGMLFVNDIPVFHAIERAIEEEMKVGEYEQFSGSVEVRVTVKNSEVPFGEVEEIEIDRV